MSELCNLCQSKYSSSIDGRRGSLCPNCVSKNENMRDSIRELFKRSQIESTKIHFYDKLPPKASFALCFQWIFDVTSNDYEFGTYEVDDIKYQQKEYKTLVEPFLSPLNADIFAKKLSKWFENDTTDEKKTLNFFPDNDSLRNFYSLTKKFVSLILIQLPTTAFFFAFAFVPSIGWVVFDPHFGEKIWKPINVIIYENNGVIEWTKDSKQIIHPEHVASFIEKLAWTYFKYQDNAKMVRFNALFN